MIAVFYFSVRSKNFINNSSAICGSKLPVGSPAIIFRLLINACAIAILFYSPPDHLPGILYCLFSSLISSKKTYVCILFAFTLVCTKTFSSFFYIIYIFTEQSRVSEKPDNIMKKMVEGRIRKFLEEIVFRSLSY